MSELILYTVRRDANRLHLTDVSSGKIRERKISFGSVRLEVSSSDAAADECSIETVLVHCE